MVDNGDNRNLALGVRNLKGVTLLATREVNPYHLLGHKSVLISRSRRAQVLGGTRKMTLYEVIRRPLVTEKGVAKKDTERTLCFEVRADANKTQVKAAVEKLFKVKVDEVRTATFDGKLRRRGRFSGYRSDWKKAYVKLKAGEKVPDFAEI